MLLCCALKSLKAKPRKVNSLNFDRCIEPGTFSGYHSVPGVLWGNVCALLVPLRPVAAEGKGPWGSQLAGADGRLQFVGEGSEDLVELLIALGLAAAGTLAAP